MKTTLVSIAVALALGALAGCDRNPESLSVQDHAAARRRALDPLQLRPTPTTPANAGTPSTAEKKDGANPVQGQVDPKQGEQTKDFQQKGAGAGPKPGG